jgi:DNA-binding transcriptional ArsR family regulator
MQATITSSFANITRLKLLVCLGNGDKNVTELIGSCGLSQSAVSQHLERLRRAKLVSTKRNGKEIIYKLTSKKSAQIADDLLKFTKEVISK